LYAKDVFLGVRDDPNGLGSQLFAAFGSSSFDHRLTGACFHTHEKAMGAGTFGVAGLVGSFAHNPIPLLQTICLIEGMG
jgi:hypothetical protein